MIIAEITLVDGDKIEMPFESWPALALWMSDEAGNYTGVNAEREDSHDAV